MWHASHCCLHQCARRHQQQTADFPSIVGHHCPEVVTRVRETSGSVVKGVLISFGQLDHWTGQVVGPFEK